MTNWGNTVTEESLVIMTFCGLPICGFLLKLELLKIYLMLFNKQGTVCM